MLFKQIDKEYYVHVLNFSVECTATDEDCVLFYNINDLSGPLILMPRIEFFKIFMFTCIKKQ